MQDLFAALALVLVIEGILPLLSPSGYRSALETMLQQDDQMLRKIAVGSILAGLLLLYLVRS
ncbi:MAG TPA: DUF2065 domain-containing protein [Gammaproteobacteria bacterium]|nr:DUF2065 domain-containing protein [Gammaproteobacteria bacterium]